MCDMVFNELSIKPLARDKAEGFKRVTKFIETFKCGRQYGFNRVRFEDSFDQILLYPEYTLNNFCNEQRILGTLLLGLARYPFIDDDSEEEKRYIAAIFQKDCSVSICNWHCQFVAFQSIRKKTHKTN